MPKSTVATLDIIDRIVHRDNPAYRYRDKATGEPIPDADREPRWLVFTVSGRAILEVDGAELVHQLAVKALRNTSKAATLAGGKIRVRIETASDVQTGAVR